MTKDVEFCRGACSDPGSIPGVSTKFKTKEKRQKTKNFFFLFSLIFFLLQCPKRL